MDTGIRLLVLDDEVPNLQTFQRVYRKHYHIQIATSGARGLQLLHDHQFDVVLTDYGMPGMSGADFVYGASRVQPVAMVMVTGYMNHPEVLALDASGEIFAVVGKPWDKQTIIDVIARASQHTQTLRGERRSPDPC